MSVQLRDCLHEIKAEIHGDQMIAVEDVFLDSRAVVAGGLFVAINGNAVDGHTFRQAAIENGAAVIVQDEGYDILPNVTTVIVPSTSKIVSLLAANFFGHPSKELKVIGITGTNGKTTTATLAYNLFNALGYKSGLLSTIENRIGQERIPASLTTPDPVSLQRLFAQMCEAGLDYVFMEVSSHALVQYRVAAVDFAVGVFTNITHDHLDYHGDFRSYLDAKKMLIDQLSKEAFAIVNADDRKSIYMRQNCRAQVRTFGLERKVDYKGKILENRLSHLQLMINDQEVFTLLTGKFNAHNVLAVVAIADSLGLPLDEVLTEVSLLKPPAGRFEMIKYKDNQPIVVVDYAHTPDALEKVLKTIRASDDLKGNLVAVVGCGGNRDKAKRPKMAQVAAQWADRVILTSDNPRHEKPEDILQDMKDGLGREELIKTITLVDRREAIQTAIQLSGESDVILVAGKGHEKYQIVGDKKMPFDDKEEVMSTLQYLAKQEK